MEEVAMIGVDLAKTLFQLNGTAADDAGLCHATSWLWMLDGEKPSDEAG